MIKRTIIYAFCLLFVFFLCLPAGAYDNDGPERKVSGGPHRAINEWALYLYLNNKAKDTELGKFLAHYDFYGSKITGETVTAGGKFERGALVGLGISRGDKTETPYWWIIEGGYTADEPELYNSFRHFYDPLMKNNKVYYLTDHLEDVDNLIDGYRKALLKKITNSDYLPDFLDYDAVNPHVDARDWAINGTQNNGVAPNDYCWNKGLEYMNEAFTNPKASDKERLFAKAWRSLGETMHLMADMTCVPHVRNDSHPGIGLNLTFDANVGLLKNDPYELLTTKEIVDSVITGTSDPVITIAKSLKNSEPELNVDPIIKKKIDENKSFDILHIFDSVALYTNTRFFSADTVSGNYGGVEIHNGNEMPDYDSPKLEKCKPDKDGYFISNINGKDIRLAHTSWFGEQKWLGELRGKQGWGTAENCTMITGACVKDQAGILIPIAVYANARLVDWFVPRVEVKITGVDIKTKELKGTITHIPYGAYKTPMLFNGDENLCELYIDGSYKVRGDEYKAKIDRGDITLIMKGDTKDIPLEHAQSAQLNILVGGIRVSSDKYSISGELIYCSICGKYVKPLKLKDGSSVCPDCNAHKGEAYCKKCKKWVVPVSPKGFSTYQTEYGGSPLVCPLCNDLLGEKSAEGKYYIYGQ